MLIAALKLSLYAVILLISIYAARHFWFTFNRLFGPQRHPYVDIDTASWPRVTVVIPAHNPWRNAAAKSAKQDARISAELNCKHIVQLVSHIRNVRQGGD